MKTKTIDNEDIFDENGKLKPIKVIFKNTNVTARLYPGIYNKDERKQFHYALKLLSKEFEIDESYVATDDNCHQDAFITEEGWEAFKEILVSTDFGTGGSAEDNSDLLDMLADLILHFLVLWLDKCGYDPETYILSINNTKASKVFFAIDDRKELEMYNKIYRYLWNGDKL